MRKIVSVEVLFVMSILIIGIGFGLDWLGQEIFGLLAKILGFFWAVTFLVVLTYVRLFKERVGEDVRGQYFVSLIAGIYGGLVVLAGDKMFFAMNHNLISNIIGGLIFLALAITFSISGLIALATFVKSEST